MYFTLTYFTLCTIALHSVYYALDSMHFTRCTYSEGLRTEEPFAKLSGTQSNPEIRETLHCSKNPKTTNLTCGIHGAKICKLLELIGFS